MLIKGADTIADTYPFPAKIVAKNSTLTLQERGCYFLWLTYSKMATIRIAKVSSTINSSYVLIENASFRSRLGNGGIHTLSAPQVSILYCHGSGEGHLSTSAKLRRFIIGFAPGSGRQRSQFGPGWHNEGHLSVVKPIWASLEPIWV